MNKDVDNTLRAAQQALGKVEDVPTRTVLDLLRVAIDKLNHSADN